MIDMSTLVSLRQNTIGQFTCAMLGHHSLSEQDEDILYKNDNGEIQTICNRCGIRLIAQIDRKYPNVYTLTRIIEED